MPMAGEGRRFLNKGWTTPKPLIKYIVNPLAELNQVNKYE